jgi:hypothetical protein
VSDVARMLSALVCGARRAGGAKHATAIATDPSGKNIAVINTTLARLGHLGIGATITMDGRHYTMAAAAAALAR